MIYEIIGFSVFWATVFLVLYCAGIVLQYYWRRYARPLLLNIKFGFFGSRKIGSYYDKWRRIYEIPGLHKHWKSRRLMRRFAYRILVIEARRENHKKNVSSKQSCGFFSNALPARRTFRPLHITVQLQAVTAVQLVADEPTCPHG